MILFFLRVHYRQAIQLFNSAVCQLRDIRPFFDLISSTKPNQVKDGIAKIQAHKRRFAVRRGKHRRESSFGSTTFTDGESDSEDESEFCGSGEWAEQGVSGVTRRESSLAVVFVQIYTVFVFLFLFSCAKRTPFSVVVFFGTGSVCFGCCLGFDV